MASTDTPFVPKREARWEYISDLIHHVEQHNCAKGCLVPDPATVKPDEPGGTCEVLVRLFLEEPMPELDDDGTTVTCKSRRPLP